MTTQPTDLPARPLFDRTIAAPVPQLSFAERMQLQEQNETTVRIFADIHDLPKATLVARYDAVRIFSTDMDDIGAWLYERGGTIHVSPERDGIQMWTLHTSTEAEGRIASVLVLVSVPVLADEPVMHEIRAAVSA